MLLKIGKAPDHGFDEPLSLLRDCHRRIEHFLQVLATISREAGGRALTASQRSQLEAAVEYFATAAPRHTADEEESLFPRLDASSSPGAARAREVLTRLERDHDAADVHHREVDVLARQWLQRGSLSPEEASRLSARLEALESIYRSHIATEDGELFPLAADLLSGDQLQDIGREMAARRRPSTG